MEQCTTVIPVGKNRDDRPDMRDLHCVVVRQQAAHWERLGLELGLRDYEIDNISKDNEHNPNRSVTCCTEMFREWLKNDTSATWNKLDQAIRNITLTTGPVTTVTEEEQAIHRVSENLRGNYSRPFFLKPHTDPTSNGLQFSIPAATPLVTATGDIIMKGLYYQISTSDYADHAKEAHDLPGLITELGNLGALTLVKGSPGIGKTTLCKSLGHQWARKLILPKVKLMIVLLLRKPKVQKIQNLYQLIHYCYGEGPEFEEHSRHAARALADTNGQDVVLVFDGLDEISEESPVFSFIQKLIGIEEQTLANCKVIITSRPIALETSNLFLNIAADNFARVKVMGITKSSRQKYFQTAFQNADIKVQQLTQCLHENEKLNELCCIPFVMKMVAEMFRENDTLSANLADLFDKYIAHVVSRFISKTGHSSNMHYDTLQKLPKEYIDNLLQLAKMAFEALGSDKIIFSLRYLQQYCPETESQHAGQIGLDLLNISSSANSESALDHNCIEFLHFSVQEFMAAYYIDSQNATKQEEILQSILFNERYFNTCVMYYYIKLSRDQCLASNRFPFERPSIFYALFGWATPRIDQSILKSKFKCLHLFQFLHEVKHSGVVLIQDAFVNGVLDFSEQDVTESNIAAIAYHLKRSSECKITDAKLCLLNNLFSDDHQLFFESVDLSHNGITLQCVTALIALMLKWNVKSLNLSGNKCYNHKNEAAFIFAKHGLKVTYNHHPFVIINNENTHLILAKTYVKRFTEIFTHNHISSVTTIHLVGCKINNDVLNLLVNASQSSNCSLVGIQLHDTGINDEGLEELSNNLQIQWLFVNEPGLSDGMVKRQALKVLDYLPSCLIVRNQHCLLIQRATHKEIENFFCCNFGTSLVCLQLKNLYLVNCDLNIKDLDLLLSSTIKMINSHNFYTFCNANINYSVIKRMVQAFKNQQLLRGMNLYEFRMLLDNKSADKIYHIASVPMIFVDKFEIRGYVALADQVIDALKIHKTVKKLLLYECDIHQEETILTLCTLFKTLPLEEVHILKTDFNASELQKIRTALSEVRSLRHVNITSQNVSRLSTQLINQTVACIAQNVLVSNLMFAELHELQMITHDLDRHTAEFCHMISKDNTFKVNISVSDVQSVVESANKFIDEMAKLLAFLENESVQRRIIAAIEENNYEPLTSHVEKLKQYCENVSAYYQEFQDHSTAVLKILNEANDIYQSGLKRQSNYVRRLAIFLEMSGKNPLQNKELLGAPFKWLHSFIESYHLDGRKLQQLGLAQHCQLAEIIANNRYLEYSFEVLQKAVETCTLNSERLLKDMLRQPMENHNDPLTLLSRTA